MQRAWRLILGVVATGVLVYLYYTEVKPVVIVGLWSDYARAIPYQAPPAGLDSLRAESCGQCHWEIYGEWESSIRVHAFEPQFFQVYLEEGSQYPGLFNCHTPLEDQQFTLINAGAGHKIPTNDPDRHSTVEFLMEDAQRQILDRQSDTMGRWIL